MTSCPLRLFLVLDPQDGESSSTQFAFAPEGGGRG
jgi:hypothetical protein